MKDAGYFENLLDQWMTRVDSGEKITVETVARELSLPMRPFAENPECACRAAEETGEQDELYLLRLVARDFNDKVNLGYEVAFEELYCLVAIGESCVKEGKAHIWFDRMGMHVCGGCE